MDETLQPKADQDNCLYFETMNAESFCKFESSVIQEGGHNISDVEHEGHSLLHQSERENQLPFQVVIYGTERDEHMKGAIAIREISEHQLKRIEILQGLRNDRELPEFSAPKRNFKYQYLSRHKHSKRRKRNRDGRFIP